jgi:hypothetical protein
MDGAKLVTDTHDRNMVDGRSGWAEAHSKVCVDWPLMRIRVIVGSEYGENPYRRKGKGFLTMYIS